jgi:hypothetical protein
MHLALAKKTGEEFCHAKPGLVISVICKQSTNVCEKS